MYLAHHSSCNRQVDDHRNKSWITVASGPLPSRIKADRFNNHGNVSATALAVAQAAKIASATAVTMLASPQRQSPIEKRSPLR